MFKSLFRLLVLVVLLAGWTLAALSLHVIRTPEKIGLIPKDRLGFKDTYVDARQWTLTDLTNHPALVKRILEARKAELFKYLTDPKNPDVAGQVAASIKDAPEAQEFRVPVPVKSLLSPATGTTPAQQSTSADVDSAITIPIDF